MTAVAVAAALDIPGWMEDRELEILAGWASECQRIVEIGVYCGRSTTAMARSLPPGGRLYAVDDWRGEQDKPELTGTALRESFRRHCTPLIATSTVVPLTMDSLSASLLLAALPPADLVFIDGAHDYGSVRNDLDAWLPLVRPGGKVAGHDADQPDIQRALNERIGAGTWTRPTDALWLYEVPG